MLKSKRIKVGAQIYSIIKDDFMYEKEQLLGQCYKDKSVIRYAGGMPIDVTVDSVLHEILHAIWWNYLDEEETTEERAVTMLSHGLVQVMRDNKKLFNELRDLL